MRPRGAVGGEPPDQPARRPDQQRDHAQRGQRRGVHATGRTAPRAGSAGRRAPARRRVFGGQVVDGRAEARPRPPGCATGRGSRPRPRTARSAPSGAGAARRAGAGGRAASVSGRPNAVTRAAWGCAAGRTTPLAGWPAGAVAGALRTRRRRRRAAEHRGGLRVDRRAAPAGAAPSRGGSVPVRGRRRRRAVRVVGHRGSGACSLGHAARQTLLGRGSDRAQRASAPVKSA